MKLLASQRVNGTKQPTIIAHRDDGSYDHAFHKIAAASGINEDQIFKKTARLSLYNLVRYTPMHIRQNRLSGCRTFFYTSEYFKREGKRGMRIFAYKTGCNRRTYLSQVGLVDYTMGTNSTIWCHCTCDYFKFNCEYVLAQLGASSNVLAWHQPPVVRNPNMVPGTCKHILLLLDDVLQRAKQYAKLDKNKELEIEGPDLDIEPELDKEYDKNKGPQPKEKDKPGLKPIKPKPFGPQQPEEPVNKPAPFQNVEKPK